jgi:4-amino-4-deoxy-L-arabinose transferase-like glycosyltransferase
MGRAATADALLNLFIVLSLFDIYRYAESEQAKHRNLAFLWAGLGFLTKGPIAVAIPGMVSLIFFGWQRRWREWLKAVCHPISLIIFLVVNLPWYLAQYLRQGQAFIDGFFLKHNVERFLSPMEGHSGGVWYFVLILLLLVFPYTALCIHLLGRLREARHSTLDRFLWVWCGFVILFFTFSGTKLPHYVLPGCTPLFLLMAKYRKTFRSRILALLPAALFLVIVVFMPEIIEQIQLRTPDTATRQMLAEAGPMFGWTYRLWAVLALAAVGALLWVKRFAAWQALLITAFITTFVVAYLVLPVGLNLMQLPVKEAALLAKQEGYEVVMWKVRMPSFSVYRQRVTPRRDPQPGEVVFTRLKNLEHLPAYDLLYEKGGFALATVGGQP